MIICEVNKNHLNVRTRELLTAGSQNVNTVEFRFSAAWDGLTKTATFKTSKKTISVLLGTNTTEIPWEVLADAGEILAVGVFGVSGETIVLPTVWGILGKVMDAAHLGDEEKEPTPDVYQKILDELNSLEKPTWETVQNKPFSTLGNGLEVDENGVLSAEGGTGGSANAVQYVAQELTDEQKAQARENIGAKAATDKSAYIISKTRSYGYIHTDGMDFDGVYAHIQSGKVVMLLVDNSATYYGVIHPASGTGAGKEIVFYNIADISDSGGRNKGIEYFGFSWRKGDDSLTEWWGDIPRVEVDSTLTNSGSAADAKAVGDALQGTIKALSQKLDKNQGTTNAGKILGIGEDGNVVPQDKPTYTLPQATSDALGGIKADAATAEDTQDVRIGADGKMRTKPYTLTDADKTAVADAVVADGIAATLEDLPSGGGEKEWNKILEAEVTEATAAFEVTGLDNYTEFLVINSGLQNATSTDSAQNLYINDTKVCEGFVDVPKSSGLAYNYARAKYNGIVWESYKSSRAISADKITQSTAYIPYNIVLGVGKATSIKTRTENSVYAPTAGKITIYGR
nr:MAG TPA: hypothetical protein [Caudoviricetes sp.]